MLIPVQRRLFLHYFLKTLALLRVTAHVHTRAAALPTVWIVKLRSHDAFRIRNHAFIGKINTRDISLVKRIYPINEIQKRRHLN